MAHRTITPYTFEDGRMAAEAHIEVEATDHAVQKIAEAFALTNTYVKVTGKSDNPHLRNDDTYFYSNDGVVRPYYGPNGLHRVLKMALSASEG